MLDSSLPTRNHKVYLYIYISTIFIHIYIQPPFPESMDWFKGGSEPETINFPIKIMGLKPVNLIICSLVPIHWNHHENHQLPVKLLFSYGFPLVFPMISPWNPSVFSPLCRSRSCVSPRPLTIAANCWSACCPWLLGDVGPWNDMSMTMIVIDMALGDHQTTIKLGKL